MNPLRPGLRPNEPAVRHLPLPESLHLLTHRDNGKPRHQHRALDAALAGAMLAELCAYGTLSVTGGLVVAGTSPPPERELASITAYGIAHDTPRPVPNWVSALARTSHQRVSESLVRQGWGLEVASRRRGNRRPPRIVAADPDVLIRTQTWLGHALASAPTLDPASAVLCALARELGMSPPTYAGLPRSEQAERRALVTASLDPVLLEVVRAVREVSTGNP